ncbi:hypothetical protein AVEN_24810-1 [Araneus ventricosus]|uniref:Uncharacterized protein n=1 Tax=Araneus ventricosus TaxID=182803 RepID=A0A4Y2BV26_ARAVE|nr:hypothetical protein AVEN_24810-1 [Araneus ventricosus]
MENYEMLRHTLESFDPQFNDPATSDSQMWRNSYFAHQPKDKAETLLQPKSVPTSSDLPYTCHWWKKISCSIADMGVIKVDNGRKGKEPTLTQPTRKGVRPLAGLWGIIIIKKKKRERLTSERKGTVPESPRTRRTGWI